jgi:hypothetical protein
MDRWGRETPRSAPDRQVAAANWQEFAGDLHRVDSGRLPPRALVPGAVDLAVVHPAERDDEFVARLAAERLRLREPKNDAGRRACGRFKRAGSPLQSIAVDIVRPRLMGTDVYRAIHLSGSLRLRTRSLSTTTMLCARSASVRAPKTSRMRKTISASLQSPSLNKIRLGSTACAAQAAADNRDRQ